LRWDPQQRELIKTPLDPRAVCWKEQLEIKTASTRKVPFYPFNPSLSLFIHKIIQQQ
jgi:hypothetical protein